MGNSEWCSCLWPVVKMTVSIEDFCLFVLVAITNLFLFSHLLAFKWFLFFNQTTKQGFLLQLVQLATCIYMCFIFSSTQISQGAVSPMFIIEQDFFLFVVLFLSCKIMNSPSQALCKICCQKSGKQFLDSVLVNYRAQMPSFQGTQNSVYSTWLFSCFY